MFDNPLEYRQVNSGAHRRRATNLKAPALVWHSAFWIPASVQGRRSFKRTLDSFVLALCRTLKEATEATDIKCNPCVEDALVLFDCIGDGSHLTITKLDHTDRQKEMRDRDYPVVTIDLHWYDLIFTVRAELYLEYFTFTVFAEIGGGNAPEFLDLEKHLSDLKAFLGGDDSTISLDALSDYFYDAFWRRLFDNMFNEEDLKPYRGDPIFTRIFADFRALVLSNEIITFPFSDQPGGDASWGYDAQRKFRPLVTDVKEFEYTASYMLGERVLYMSDLGPQRPARHQDERTPLTYLLYVHQQADKTLKTPVNKWQLGRLVDRINLLGTVRLAALKNYPALRDAGISLSRLDPINRKARDAVTAHRTSGAEARAIDCITEAHEEFNSVTDEYAKKAEKEVDDKGNPLDAAGLLYRIEQSRYYVEQFRTNIKPLRISRIEGTQRYDEFVERRLGATFDFIDRLGQRYERALNSLTMLDQNYLAIRANRTGSDVRDLAIRANRTSNDVREIQRYADLALIGALIPYYLIGQLAHAIGEEASNRPLLQAMTVFVSALFFALAMYRFIEPHAKAWRRSKKVGAAMLAFVAAVAIWVAIFFLQDHWRDSPPPAAAPHQTQTTPEGQPR